MRISDWSSDVCSSDLAVLLLDLRLFRNELPPDHVGDRRVGAPDQEAERVVPYLGDRARIDGEGGGNRFGGKGEEEIGRASCRERCVSTCRSRWSPNH